MSVQRYFFSLSCSSLNSLSSSIASRRVVKFHYSIILFHCLSLWLILDRKVQHQIYSCRHSVIQSLLVCLKTVKTSALSLLETVSSFSTILQATSTGTCIHFYCSCWLKKEQHLKEKKPKVVMWALSSAFTDARVSHNTVLCLHCQRDYDLNGRSLTFWDLVFQCITFHMRKLVGRTGNKAVMSP